MSIPALRFALLVVVNGVLMVRPTELIASLAGAPVYELFILCGLAVSAPAIFEQLTARSLKANPVTLCVVGVFAAVGLSHLRHFQIGEATRGMLTFLKVLLSYLFIVGGLDTPARLRRFAGWLFVFILTLTTLALLQHYEVIDNPALAAHRERVFDEESGDVLGINERLSGAGIFGNPNDLSRILAVGIVLCLYFLGSAPGLVKPVWVLAIGVFGHALLLTQSRGGLIALGGSLFTIAAHRIGFRRALLLAGPGVLVIGFVAGGRQAEVSTSKGTGQQRIRLWSDGLSELTSSPLFGTGMGTYEALTGGLGAHNSFVHAYTELGFLGGTLFFGAVFCALNRCMAPVGWAGTRPHSRLREIRPYLLAILVGYAAGMLSSSRSYAIPTYLLLALVAAYGHLATAYGLLPAVRVTPSRVRQLVLLSAIVLVGFKIFVLTSANFDSS